MRMVSVTRVEPGMRLAKSIFGANGNIMLRKGVELNNAYVTSLKQKGYAHLYIEDAATHDIEEVDSIPVELREEVIRKIQSIFHAGDIRNTIKSGKLGREFTSIYRLLFSHLQQNANMMVTLSAIYSSDAYTYTHCMNVAAVATVLGLAHGYSNDQVEELGIGAMLHDIGKVEISPAIVNKPGKLTSDERMEMERHCQLGYEMLRTQPDLPESSAVCALSHHERMDGTGYPYQLVGNDIPEFGRMLAVPDVFDAMTSNRSYRAPVLPSEVLEYLFSRTYTHFDPHVVELFVHHVNIYPVGLPVRLSNKLSGVVSRPNGGNIQRPVVLVTEDECGQKTSPYEMDLSTQLNVTITKCLL